jgi:hypothetical protein
MNSRADFTDGAVPVLAAAGGSVPDGRGAMVLLVIDDSREDDITAAIAAAARDTPFAHEFSGEWGYFNDRTGAVARFTLESAARETDRMWLVNDPPHDMVLLLERDHVVVLMPAEIAGDLTGGIDFSGISPRLKGSLLVKVTYPDPGAASER